VVVRHFLEQFVVKVETGIAGFVAMLEYNVRIRVADQWLYPGRRRLVVLCWLGSVDNIDKVRVAGDGVACSSSLKQTSSRRCRWRGHRL
jgi:hypothetical protein